MRRFFLAATVSIAVLIGGTPAAADMSHSVVVTQNPVDWTPHILDGTVRAIALMPDRVVVGGDFSAVNDGSGVRQARYLFAFNRRTGAIDPAFAPALDGPVYALAAGPNGTVYAGGIFRTVDGTARRGLTRLDLATGKPTPGFAASINWGDVRSILTHNGKVYVGGTFSAINRTKRFALAKIDGTTGIVDTGFDAHLAAPELDRVRVEDMALAPDGQRLVAVGALSLAAGQPRAQLAMLDAGSGAPLDWYTDAYQPRCREGFDTYMRGVDFAPDGSYFVVVTTGRLGGEQLTCDTAARFETQGPGRHSPTWVNHTGGDSLYSVSITGAAVYVGGHQRWLDNPYGQEDAGPGAVSREGIAAIDPVTGLALPWNPTKSRGVGVRALVAAPEGLYIGSDTERLAGEYHARLGLLPL